MKKLKLNLDEIKVESFVTEETALKKGTVNGYLTAPPNTDEVDCTSVGCGGGTSTQCADTDCPWCTQYGDTCNSPSCTGTCENSCGPGTCHYTDCTDDSCYCPTFAICPTQSVSLCLPTCWTESCYCG